MLIGNYRCEDDKVTLSLSGMGDKEVLHIKRLTDEKMLEEEVCFTVFGSTEITLTLPKLQVLFVTVE